MPNRGIKKRKGATKSNRCNSRQQSKESDVGYSLCKNKNCCSSTTNTDAGKQQGQCEQRNASLASDSNPAELFRKDLISAMKLPDSQPLPDGRYIKITDAWKLEWEKGVQVPVNPESISQPTFRELNLLEPRNQRFSRPRGYIKEEVRNSVVKPKYELDELDMAWLQLINNRMDESGGTKLNEQILEAGIYALEMKCYEKMAGLIESEKLGIEYDDDVQCDVCQSPYSEDDNEMVFCDSCNICVHQACYGISVIPSGNWYCEPCRLGIRYPACIFCPKKGGAMKKTSDGNRWGHVSCTLWIPETRMGNPDRMQPITRINRIPASRWTLICRLCQEKYGACIQCSVTSCKVAFHVTCAIRSGLIMIARLDNAAPGGVKHDCYCSRHADQYTYTEESLPNNAISERDKRLQKVREDFYTYVHPEDILEVVSDLSLASTLHKFWAMKRKNLDNAPLLPKPEDSDENEMADNKDSQTDFMMRVRQDMEKVRNLCYMVIKREKLQRELLELQESITAKRLDILRSDYISLTDEERRCLSDFKDDLKIFLDPKDLEVASSSIITDDLLGHVKSYKKRRRLSKSVKLTNKLRGVEKNTETEAKVLNRKRSSDFTSPSVSQAKFSPHVILKKGRYDVTEKMLGKVTVQEVSSNADKEAKNRMVKVNCGKYKITHSDTNTFNSCKDSEIDNTKSLLREHGSVDVNLSSRVLHDYELDNCNNENFQPNFSVTGLMSGFCRRIFVK